MKKYLTKDEYEKRIREYVTERLTDEPVKCDKLNTEVKNKFDYDLKKRIHKGVVFKRDNIFHGTKITTRKLISSNDIKRELKGKKFEKYYVKEKETNWIGLIGLFVVILPPLVILLFSSFN